MTYKKTSMLKHYRSIYQLEAMRSKIITLQLLKLAGHSLRSSSCCGIPPQCYWTTSHYIKKDSSRIFLYVEAWKSKPLDVVARLLKPTKVEIAAEFDSPSHHDNHILDVITLINYIITIIAS